MTAVPTAAGPSGLFGRALHRAVRGYQYLFAWRPSPCRYVPSCSNYALEAIETHGGARGALLAGRRICRCHPWGGSGWDPVPDADRGVAEHASVASPAHPDPRTAESSARKET